MYETTNVNDWIKWIEAIHDETQGIIFIDPCAMRAEYRIKGRVMAALNMIQTPQFATITDALNQQFTTEELKEWSNENEIPIRKKIYVVPYSGMCSIPMMLKQNKQGVYILYSQLFYGTIKKEFVKLITSKTTIKSYEGKWIS